MKKILLLAVLLTGCTMNPAPTAPYAVELAGNIHGMYVECGNDLDCQARCAGVCRNGYWTAEIMNSLAAPVHQVGIVVVCGKLHGQ